MKVLTIAGSDSGGAAGLQADLKTFSALGAYGSSVVTVVTAQNSRHVTGEHSIPADFVADQIEAVLSDYGAAAVKTGFIGRVDVVKTIAGKLSQHRSAGRQFQLVVDPVLVNQWGEAMFPPAVAKAYVDHLLPLADLVTPNLVEVTHLGGLPVTSLAAMESAARAIHDQGPRWVLIKGGRFERDMVDLLFDGQDATLMRGPYLQTENTHGSGDTLSAAVCVFLAKGLPMEEAVERGRAFTVAAIRGAVDWRLGSGHGPLNHWAPEA